MKPTNHTQDPSKGVVLERDIDDVVKGIQTQHPGATIGLDLVQGDRYRVSVRYRQDYQPSGGLWDK